MALTSSLLPRLASAESAARTNWAGNLTYHTNTLLTPTSVAETRQIVKSTPKLRALGSRHSFNAIADSTSAQISLHDLDSMELDAAARTVTVGAGVRYGTLAPYIDKQGYALHNLASLPSPVSRSSRPTARSSISPARTMETSSARPSSTWARSG
jgi:xylitol oxidase